MVNKKGLNGPIKTKDLVSSLQPRDLDTLIRTSKQFPCAINFDARNQSVSPTGSDGSDSVKRELSRTAQNNKDSQLKTHTQNFKAVREADEDSEVVVVDREGANSSADIKIEDGGVEE